MYKLAVMAALVIAVSGKPEVHRFVHVQDEIEIPQDIVYDKEEQTVLITVAPVPKMTTLVPTINFHDYKTGFVAFKDVYATKCFLSYPPIPKPTPDIYRIKKTKMSLPSTARISDNVMSPEAVYRLAGERIHEFCLDYDTYWMDLTPGMPQARGKRSVISAQYTAPCVFNCGICAIFEDYSERTNF